MKSKFILAAILLLISQSSFSQLHWTNVDSLYLPLPPSVHVFKSTDLIEGKPNISYYVVADLNEKKIGFRADTTYRRRLTPADFLLKNKDAVVIINTSFFSFSTHQNLNLMMNDGQLLAYNTPVIGKGKDTFTYRHPLGSALGITKNRRADVAWLYTDSNRLYPIALQKPIKAVKDSTLIFTYEAFKKSIASDKSIQAKKWKMHLAVGGGPVVLQNGKVAVSNNEELKFAGKAIEDRHPRTAMGYTSNGKLILLVVAGRRTGTAEGATLPQLGQILADLGCVEGINLDGGGSSCMLINGKPTIEPSDKEGQRMVPGVFMIVK